MKKPKRRPRFPRLRPEIDTSSRIFLDGKSKSRTRRALKAALRDELDRRT